MHVLLGLLVFVSVNYVVSVPHNPNSVLADELKVEFSTLKNTMKLLSGNL